MNKYGRPDNITKAVLTLKDKNAKIDVEAGLKFLEEKYGPKLVATYEENGRKIKVYEKRSAL